jgi:prenyltransferase beta subunit
MEVSSFKSCRVSFLRGFFGGKVCLRVLALAVGAALSCSSVFAGTPVITTDAAVTIDPATKQIIRGALKYLASKQHLDGSWSLREGLAGHPVAMTGYTLLAFMAAGNLPEEGDYSKNVSLGMQFLLDSIQPDGLYRGVSQQQYMYNHGIATIALAELYGETHSPTIHAKLQRVLDVIIKAQNPAGGWRYTPQARDADVSVTVLQVVALRAAQEAGLAVPQQSIERAITYVNSCYQPKAGGFSYQPGGDAGFARTAAATYSLQVLGKYDDTRVANGSAYLFAHSNEGAFWTYGNYYAAPAQYMVGGDTWRKWYAGVKQVLLSKVIKEGDSAHWEETREPRGDLGPVFFTAVSIHILAMPYHFLPLYQR